MIKEAVENLGGKATYSEIKDYIRNKYGEVNESTINCQIIVCTVMISCSARVISTGGGKLNIMTLRSMALGKSAKTSMVSLWLLKWD
jgi:hypothetical protein